jgi:hypothetical protein
MKCPQCESVLVEPRGSEKYCETCGYPEENRCEFSLVEIKAYIRSMFQKQNCVEDIRIENHSLACAYNLLTDDKYGITQFCDDNKAEGLTLSSFAHVKM